MEDNDLAVRAAQGEERAFATLVERYRRYIYAIAWRIVLNEEDALDITQNVFLLLARKIGDWRGSGAFRSWLATIATREALSHHRRPSRREVATEPEKLIGLTDSNQASGGADPRADLERKQRREWVAAAMEDLSPQQRAIIGLRLKEDLEPTEIAARLGVPAAQVRAQMHRVIVKFREALKEERR